MAGTDVYNDCNIPPRTAARLGRVQLQLSLIRYRKGLFLLGDGVPVVIVMGRLGRLPSGYLSE